MPVNRTNVKGYLIYINSTGYDYIASIKLFDADGNVCGRLNFYPLENTPQQNHLGDSGYPLVSYPLSALSHVIDILRNEKPITFTWHDMYSLANIGTSWEPAGEEEGA